MKRVPLMLCVLGLLLISTKTKADTSASDFAGEWKSGLLNGISTTQQPECKMISFIERTLHFERVPGRPYQLRGQWGRETTFTWIATNRGQCRWASENTFSPAQSADVLYSVDGLLEPRNGSLTIDGTYESCTGNACADLLTPEMKKPFHTVLMIRDSAIVDTDASVNGQMRFIRTNAAVEREEAARLNADSAMSHIDNAEYDQFFQGAWSFDSLSPTFLKDTRAGFVAARESRGYVVSRTPVRAIYGEMAPGLSQTPGDYVLLLRDVVTSKNASGREIVMTGIQNGKWKVVWFDFIT